MTKKEDARIEQEAFEAFSYLHPHESYATYPDRFWKYFHRLRPHLTRNQMEQILKETEKET